MRLVEVIRHDTTSDQAYDLTKDFVRSIGKKILILFIYFCFDFICLYCVLCY